MRLRFFTRTVAVVIAAATWLPAASFAKSPITHCGQSVLGRAYLPGDLDCTGFNGHAVEITRGRLDLNGFTIRGANFYGVHCLGPCRVYGPGTITENGLDGIHAEDWVIVRNARVTNNAVNGISGGNRVLLNSVIVTGNSFNGVEADNSVVIRYSTIADNGSHGIDLGVQNCDTAGRVVLRQTNATGNGSTCINTPVCADITACGRSNPKPRLGRNSVCGKSYVRESGVPGLNWDICSED